uniref:General transcription factor IIF subunit 2 n=1 Tax=Oncorhynchus kisutch TaxID=8019 RepID=A0A8C7I182_ONCKI
MSEKTEVDLTGAKQNDGVWLVKVPHQCANLIHGSVVYPQVSFTLNEDLTSLSTFGEKAASVRAPRDHPMTMHSVWGKTVFTESSADKISLEGIMVQRAECRPHVNENYMKLKSETKFNTTKYNEATVLKNPIYSLISLLLSIRPYIFINFSASLNQTLYLH